MDAIADPGKLVSAVLEHSTGKRSRSHGEHHWKLVGWIGAELAREQEAADRTVVFLFALFHDSMRENDGWDPEHGRRGAALAQQLWARLRFATIDQMDELVFACNAHTDGEITDDPTVGTCWDADRLNLWRVGTEPAPGLLSMEAARDPRRIEAARELQARSLSWTDVAARFAAPAL